jgi:hypothetical protein
MHCCQLIVAPGQLSVRELAKDAIAQLRVGGAYEHSQQGGLTYAGTPCDYLQAGLLVVVAVQPLSQLAKLALPPAE